MMHPRLLSLLLAVCSLTVAGCGLQNGHAFREDVAFLAEHTDVIVLSGESGENQVAVVPQMQGRIMTSTARGAGGLSFGWMNRELIASGEFVEHINVFGGEDRFWLGPEGGQFSIFFEKGVPFDLEHWYTPAPIDTEPFALVRRTPNTASFMREMQLTNYSGTKFKLRVDRDIRLIEGEQARAKLGFAPDDSLGFVAFESVNRLTNIGIDPWKKETGLLSIWILGMFNPSPQTTIVIPYRPGPVDELGPVVNDEYFGKIPDDRLIVDEDVIFFKGDGQYRSKLGLSPYRARSVLGSYDALNKVLTIVRYNKPEDETDYVNSMWELQDKPYAGDVVNSYNDGPPAPGAEPMGPFYELETSSPAAALGPGQTIRHVHSTFHLQGSEAALNVVAQEVLGVTLEKITTAFSN